MITSIARKPRDVQIEEPATVPIAQMPTQASLGPGISAAYQPHVYGDWNAPVVVLCEPPRPDAHKGRMPITREALQLVAKYAVPHGFGKGSLLFVGICPPMPPEAVDSQSRKWKHVEPCIEGVWNVIERVNPRCLVTFGDLATRVGLGRAVSITKSRGTAMENRDGPPVFPMLSPGFVSRIPDHMPTFASDWASLRRFVDGGYQITDTNVGVQYEWREDISDILALQPEIIGLDTETTGLRWHDPRVEVITVQISWAPGKSAVVPVHRGYWPEWNGRPRAHARLMGQLRQLLEDPRVKKVGHNLKFDFHMLRKLSIELKGWSDDTQLEAFAVDENMMEKSLDECVRRWVPEMAGYADIFNQNVDKSKMLEVPRDQMLPYAGGDPDAALRLHRALKPRLEADRFQSNIYHRILMPGIRTFASVVERYGMLVDQDRLREFGQEVDLFNRTEYDRLISMVPPKVRQAHLAAKKELSFSRADFVKDTLFGPDGFRLKPVVFTKSTSKLPDAEKVPSTSAKDHLPFFTERGDRASEFVLGLIEYQKAQKLAGTYIGDEEARTGMWQYIAPNSRIYPSYALHSTVTGRTASRDPNGQNFPKRGRFAKPYQKIFRASPGFKLINCDLSQIELRIAAWMAMEPTMLRIYREGGDIHTATALAVTGMTRAEWDALDKTERKLLRTKAKAVNFGFLYGMGWRKFKNFAKTDYGVTYTDAEAQTTRERFFSTYTRLPAWHDRMRAEAKRNGSVRSLHGALRHLPSMTSDDPMIVSSAERQAINSPVQRFGSDLGLVAMIRFSAQADPALFRIIGFVHDALVMEAREGHEKEGIESLLWTMNNPPLQDWFGLEAPLPILAEADIGINGGEMLELAELPEPGKRPTWFTELGWDTVSPTKPDWWDDTIDADPERLFARI